MRLQTARNTIAAKPSTPQKATGYTGARVRERFILPYIAHRDPWRQGFRGQKAALVNQRSPCSRAARWQRRAWAERAASSNGHGTVAIIPRALPCERSR
ncbi:MAG: hypothetical protein Tsb0020_45660 [Haliangiales bacterium]